MGRYLACLPQAGLNSWNGTSAFDDEPQHERYLADDGGLTEEEERFLSALGMTVEAQGQKKSARFVRNDGVFSLLQKESEGIPRCARNDGGSTRAEKVSSLPSK